LGVYGGKEGMIVNKEGSATNMEWCEGNKLLCFIVNDLNKWGKGFCLEVSAKWPGVKKAYSTYLQDKKEVLGNTVFVKVSEDTTVALMFAQHGIFPKCIDDEIHDPIRYPEFENCFMDVLDVAKETNATIHMPVLNHQFGEAKWGKINKIIHKHTDGNIYVYGLDK
jgi:hypothetical protein